MQTLHKNIGTFTQGNASRAILRVTHPLCKCYTQVSLARSLSRVYKENKKCFHKNNLLPIVHIQNYSFVLYRVYKKKFTDGKFSLN